MRCRPGFEYRAGLRSKGVARRGGEAGRRIGKPVKVRHCPRNGKAFLGSRIGHWEKGSREGAAPGQRWLRVEVRKPASEPFLTAGGGWDPL